MVILCISGCGDVLVMNTSVFQPWRTDNVQNQDKQKQNEAITGTDCTYHEFTSNIIGSTSPHLRPYWHAPVPPPEAVLWQPHAALRFVFGMPPDDPWVRVLDAPYVPRLEAVKFKDLGYVGGIRPGGTSWAEAVQVAG